MRNTIRTVSEKIARGLSSKILIPNFIDDFTRLRDREQKLALVSEPPIAIKSVYLEAYLAAMTEYLCHRDGLPVPGWTQEKRYFLKEAHYALGKKGSPISFILLAESPVPFRRRNIFVSANAMTRV